MEKLLKLYKYIDGVNDVPFPNEEQQVITSDFRYDVKRMGGAPMITCTIMHVLCLDKIWDDNVYTYFNGERFYIKQVPSSSYDHTDSRYKHEVELVSERIVLDNVYFYDVVDEDDYSKPVSNSTSFTFFGDIHEFAHRLNQSLKYSKVGYNVVVDDGISSEAKQVSFKDQVFSNVLQEAFNTYEIPYYFDGKTIHIGFTNNTITKTFKYGSDESLLSIQKQNANYKIVNRVTGVGSSDNIPYYYPNFDEKGVTRLLYNGEVGGVYVINQTKYKKVKLGTTFVYDATPTVTTELFDRKDYKLGYYSDLYTPEGEIEPGFTRFQVQFSYSFYLNEMQQVRLDLNSLSDNSIRIDFTVVRQEGGYMEQFFDKNHFEGSLGQGTYNVLITWEFKDIMSPNAIQDWQMKAIIDRDFVAYGDTVKEGHTSWMYNNTPVKLYDYGIEVNVEPNDGDKITFERVSYMKPQESLMPSIYRETNGENRFYNALNNTYVSPQTGKYYHFNNPYINGKPKEHIVNFEDIKPTIKGMTNSNGLRIDMFTEFAYDLNDNDEFDEEGKYLHPYFFGKLRRMDGEYGFNLFDHAIEEDEMVISMTSGACGSCEWIIGVSEDRQENIVQVDERGNLLRDANGNVIRSGSAQPQQNDTINNEVWIALKKDINTFGVVMPNANANYKPQAGDTFVILHIDLPQAYILDAENRLKDELIKYMATNNDEKFNFSISFSRIFFAENPNILSQLNENSRIRIEYDNEVYELYISSYSYSMSRDNLLPEIRVDLSDTLTIAQNALQNAISEVKDDILSNIGKSSDFSKQGLRHFLRKDKDDKTTHNLGVGKNLSVGEDLEVKGSASIQEGLSIGGNIESKDFAEGTENGGYAIRKNSEEQYEVESDNIIARILAKTYDLLVQNNATFVGDLSSEEFISGFIGGKGWSIRTKEILNAEGINEKKSVAEFDDLIVRGSMRIYEFIVSQLLGENDNRIFTGMMEVDHYDVNDGKVYLKTNNGRLYNPFRVDDVIIVQQYGGNHSQESGYYVTKQYEFIVTEVGVGEQGEDRLDWVRFRNFTTSMKGGNEELITEYDTLVRIDNISDANRKGIIQLMSVGEDTPYMDFIYGAKTDPENSLKGRLGNLGGVYNPLFGWLKEFGAYLTNLYAVGEFVIAHTGENVSDSIEIAKGQFRTNYRQTTYDMSEEQNFFTNASMTNNCEHWVLGSDATEYFMVDELPQFFNFDLYASEQTYAGLSEWKGRDMLRLSKSSIMQSNSLIDKAGTHKVYTGSVENADGSYTDTYEEVTDTLYLSVRFFVSVSGKLEFGFVENGKFINNSFHYSSNVTAREDGYEVKLSGIWDGKGDFTITSTGDVYVDLLSLTDKPLDNFKITTETKIEQDANRISLLGKKINGVEGSVTDLGIELNAAEERIRLYVNKEVEGVNSSISQLQIEDGRIATLVATAQGSADNAKKLADAAQDAADAAAAEALKGINAAGAAHAAANNAQSSADAAQSTADAAKTQASTNATAISQNKNSISLLAGAFTLKNGKYELTEAAGAVITSKVAELYATKKTVNDLTGTVSSHTTSISAMSGQIALKASQSSVNSLTGRVSSAESSISQNATSIALKVSKDGVISAINQSVEKITIAANRVDLSGVVTVTAFNSALADYATDSELAAAKSTLNKSISDLNTTLSGKINTKASTESLNSKVNELNGILSGKVDTSKLGSLAYLNDVADAALGGSTLIVGGYLNTDLIKVKKILAEEGSIGAYSISATTLETTNNITEASPGNPAKQTMELTAEGVKTITRGHVYSTTQFGLKYGTIVDTYYYYPVEIVHGVTIGNTTLYGAAMCGIKMDMKSDDIGLFVQGGSTHILSSGITKLYGLVLNYRTMSTGGTLTANDDVIAFTNSRNITVNLPTGVPMGKVYYLKNIGSANVTLKGTFRHEDAAGASSGNTRALNSVSWIVVNMTNGWSLFMCG